jgi:hypothetical protein
MAETPDWQQQLQQLHARLLALTEAQIQSWHMEREELLARVERRFANVGVESTHIWQGPDQPLREIRTAKDVEGVKEDFIRATEMTREDREWRAVEQTPAYQAWEREQNRPVHEPDADERGWQAEQRFYAEQDPASQWYREDLYHGQMGPDVLADYHRTAEEERLGALEEMAFDEAQFRRAAQEPMSAADIDNWEPTLAEQQAYEDRPYDAMEERAHFGEEQRLGLPADAILVDTSNPQMEEGFQALLARLDQRLDALSKETESETQQMQHKQGMSY